MWALGILSYKIMTGYTPLEKVKYPGFNRDIVSFGMVKEIIIDDEHVSITLIVNSNNESILTELKNNVEKVLLETKSEHC